MGTAAVWSQETSDKAVEVRAASERHYVDLTTAALAQSSDDKLAESPRSGDARRPCTGTYHRAREGTWRDMRRSAGAGRQAMTGPLSSRCCLSHRRFSSCQLVRVLQHSVTDGDSDGHTFAHFTHSAARARHAGVVRSHDRAAQQPSCTPAKAHSRRAAPRSRSPRALASRSGSRGNPA